MCLRLNHCSIIKTIFLVGIVLLTQLFVSQGKIRKTRTVIYPKTSYMGLFIAIALPVDIPNQSVFVSYNFEGNFKVPNYVNELGDMTLFAPITEQARSFDRKLTYNILEDKFNKSGISGRYCLLRSICEAAQDPVDHHGVLGGIMHVIFRPSTSKEESLPASYYLAEKRGLAGDCTIYTKHCPSGLFDSISKII